jgi:hypothetical protein
MKTAQDQKFLYFVLAICAMISATAFSDEWRPRHALVPPTGVLNLTQPAGPADVLLPGPENPAAADAWRTQMKAWREERLQRLRYQGTEYERRSSGFRSTRSIFQAETQKALDADIG